VHHQIQSSLELIVRFTSQKTAKRVRIAQKKYHIIWFSENEFKQIEPININQFFTRTTNEQTASHN